MESIGLTRQDGSLTCRSSANTLTGISSAKPNISAGDVAVARNRDLARAGRAVSLLFTLCPSDGSRASMRVKQNASGSPCVEVWKSAARMPLPSASSTNRSQATAPWRLGSVRSSKGIGMGQTLRGIAGIVCGCAFQVCVLFIRENELVAHGLRVRARKQP